MGVYKPSEEVKSEIQRILFEVADNHDVTILYATDYGSRSRGVHSTGSDYDVTFIFCQSHIDYTLPPEYTETIVNSREPEETSLDTEVELHGWNLRKIMGGTDLKGNSGGVLASNPMAVEILMSNISYYTYPCTTEYWDVLESHVSEHFKPYALMRHYRSLAEGNYKKYIEGEYVIEEGVSWDGLLDYVDENAWPGKYIVESAMENIEVDPERTTIGEETTDIVGKTATSVLLDHVETERLIEDGLVRRTSRDISTKRYLVIVQALFKRVFIEETKEMPPMEVSELIRSVAGMVPQGVYADAGRLSYRKREMGGNEEPPGYEQSTLNTWIEQELERDVEPDGYVERQPDLDVVREQTRNIMRTVY